MRRVISAWFSVSDMVSTLLGGLALVGAGSAWFMVPADAAYDHQTYTASDIAIATLLPLLLGAGAILLRRRRFYGALLWLPIAWAWSLRAELVYIAFISVVHLVPYLLAALEARRHDLLV